MNENEQSASIAFFPGNDENRRAHALDCALRTSAAIGRDHHEVLLAAKAYEAYLRGGDA